eukprot:CAMPEP_0204877720 /NCGR_PEP_ID=MMETSP1348-20121228/48350_1 /ASSEMBLY_ACC=CAM_ASM_000700 /TAXON_ID=215587 /ORGANISM="Aplanochytrium stocchinoi, Strain GSBS06" /LENGTH=134 /DNA_ID=CAMNT_0052034623 /DNA_START=665 /DNA_END=1069 /DNA_ORIENTATION=-
MTLTFITIKKLRKHGEILGVPRAEVADFYYIALTMYSVFIFIFMAGILTVKQEELITSSEARNNYYVFRTITFILAAFVPVVILHIARWSRYKHRLKAEESGATKVGESTSRMAEGTSVTSVGSKSANDVVILT